MKFGNTFLKINTYLLYHFSSILCATKCFCIFGCKQNTMSQHDYLKKRLHVPFPLGVLGGVVSFSSYEFVITFFKYVGKFNFSNLLVGDITSWHQLVHLYVISKLLMIQRIIFCIRRSF